VWIETHTGRALRSLVLWRGGAAHEVKALAPGARARGQAIDAQAAEARASNPPYNAVIGYGDVLAEAIKSGELGADRYVARYAWTQQGSSLLGPGIAPRASPEHVIMGILR
jgi:hypothetical protein